MTLSFDDEKRQIEVEKEDDKKTIRKSGIISMQKATENHSCRVYEIKHTTEAFPLQCRHLLDEEKLNMMLIQRCRLFDLYLYFWGESDERERFRKIGKA